MIELSTNLHITKIHVISFVCTWTWWHAVVSTFANVYLFVFSIKYINQLLIILCFYDLGSGGAWTSYSTTPPLFVLVPNRATAFGNAIVTYTIQAAVHKLAAAVDIHGSQDRTQERFPVSYRASGSSHERSSRLGTALVFSSWLRAAERWLHGGKLDRRLIQTVYSKTARRETSVTHRRCNVDS